MGYFQFATIEHRWVIYIYIETFSPCRHHCRACSTAQVGSGKHNQLHVLIKLVILCKYLYLYIAVVIFIMNETEATVLPKACLCDLVAFAVY